MENQENNNSSVSPLSKREKRELRQQEKEILRREIGRSRLYKRISLWAVVFVLLSGSVWGMVKIAKIPRREPASIVSTITEQDRILGDKNSKIILTEFSDLQCPACAAYNPVVKQLLKERGDKIVFIYKHFPLPRHKNAYPAAWAAEAAGEQGKFWEMIDVIFLKQSEWEKASDAKEIFFNYARGMGLDLEKFSRDYDSETLHDKIERDLNDGTLANLDHTPTFFLNGQEIPNPKTYDEFRQSVDQALNQ